VAGRTRRADDRTGSRFRRVEPRRRRGRSCWTCWPSWPRKNCWTIAEHAWDLPPDRMQHLLARAKWDAGGVRDDTRGYVIEHLSDPGAGTGDQRDRGRQDGYR
jgi:hypothetical protein